MSKQFLLQALEPRCMLSAVRPLDYFWTVTTPGAKWNYLVNTSDYGNIGRISQTVSAKTTKIHEVATRAFVSRPELNTAYYSIGAGAVRLHKETWQDDAKVGYQMYTRPKPLFPASMEMGRSYTGKANWRGRYEDGSIWTGTESSTSKAVQFERVKVRAGTFNALKIIVTSQETETSGTRKSKDVDTTTFWMARGVGPVKMVSSEKHTNYVNGVAQPPEFSQATLTLFSYAIPRATRAVPALRL